MAQSYDHFASIWRAIDDGDINALVNNPDLPYLINDKQKGVTPLFLVRHKLDNYGWSLAGARWFDLLGGT